MIGRIAAMTGLCMLTHAAFSQPACLAPAVMVGSRPIPQIVIDGLAVNRYEGKAMLWPAAIHTKLNLAYPVELAFEDRTNCVTTLPRGAEAGAAISHGRKVVIAIDAAVCDDADGFCVPVHIEFSR